MAGDGRRPAKGQRPAGALRHWWLSLRIRLTLVGFVAIYLPVLLLTAVVVASEEIDETLAPDDAGGTAVTEIEIESEQGPTTSPLVLATTIALAPLAAALAWWLAGSAVRPLNRMRAVAEEIEAGDLDRRIGLTTGPSEIVGLAASFDAMLERLGDAAALQHRLIEETSHELRTPLAVLRTNADVLLAHPDPDLPLYRDGLERSKLTAERLKTIVDELLVDARGRARVVDRQPSDLVAVVAAVITQCRPLAAAAGVGLELDSPAELRCRLDASSVERAIGNLVDNAIRHAPSGTSVDITVEAGDGAARVVVSDRGPGIPADQQALVFDRFWRANDTGRGVGLGLPIAKQIADAHGGKLSLESPGHQGAGCRFELQLPR